ncbi:MAG: hypothetical protein JST43_14190 [Bacteroidetes bacterium]|nr:hypothetical protein [Bacteroidota bacterium]
MQSHPCLRAASAGRKEQPASVSLRWASLKANHNRQRIALDRKQAVCNLIPACVPLRQAGKNNPPPFHSGGQV